jgi:hypothetical protein
MTFREAADFVLPLRRGKWGRMKIDRIAETDEGLLYLDWLVGQDWIRGPLKEALITYLGDQSIKRDLEELVRRSGERGI